MTEPAHAAEGTDTCPESEDLRLLRQWQGLHTGVRRLTDELLAEVEERNGLAPSSYQALMFLVTAPGRAAPMNRLSQALGFSTAGTTKVVDRLVDAGLVERRPSGSDRRVTYTELTAAGTARVLAASHALVQALRSRVVGPLGEDGFAAVTAAIASIQAGPADEC